MTSYNEMNLMECSALNLPFHLKCEKCKYCIPEWSCGRPWCYRKGKRGRYNGVTQHPNFVAIWDYISIDSKFKPPPGYYTERLNAGKASMPLYPQVSDPTLIEPSPPRSKPRLNNLSHCSVHPFGASMNKMITTDMVTSSPIYKTTTTNANTDSPLIDTSTSNDCSPPIGDICTMSNVSEYN